jgi:hypothetical protein
MIAPKRVYMYEPIRVLGRDGVRDVRDRAPSIGWRRSMTTIYAEDLRPGDVVDYDGHPHHVARVDRRDGWAWPVAFDDAGWAMALGHDLVAVHHAA